MNDALDLAHDAHDSAPVAGPSLSPNRKLPLGVLGKGSWPKATLTIRHLLGARKAPRGFADFGGYIDRVRDVGGSGASVAFAVARVLHVRAQVELFGEKPMPARIPYPSELGIYSLAANGALGLDPSVLQKALESAPGVPLERDAAWDATKLGQCPAEALSKAPVLKAGPAYLLDSVGQERVLDACAVLDGWGPFAVSLPMGPVLEAGDTKQGKLEKALGPEAADAVIVGSVDAVVIGYRTVGLRRQFRALLPFGVGWGTAGAAWLDESWLADVRTTNARVHTVVVYPPVAAKADDAS